MTTQFTATFTRYDGRKVEMRESSPQPLWAATFEDAFRRAQDILQGLREADTERVFSIHSLSGSTLHRATACNGSRMFETMEEMMDRIESGGRAEASPSEVSGG